MAAVGLSGALARPLFWLLLSLAALAFWALARRMRLAWKPALALRVLLAALALAAILSPLSPFAAQATPQREVLVVDQSDSLAPEKRLELQQAARQWQAGQENRLVVAFGSEAQVVPDSRAAWPAVDSRGSDVDAALRLAGSLLGDIPGRVIVATDGRVPPFSGAETVPEALARQGHALDVIALEPRLDPADGAVGRLGLPSGLWARVPFDLVVPVYPPQSGGPTRLSLAINGQPQALQAEPLEGNLFRFRLPGLPEGISTLQVTAEFGDATAAPDSFPANNQAYASLQVFAAPRALYVASQPGSPEAQSFVDALNSSGLPVETAGPDALPTDLNSLSAYRVIFLDNLLSSQLSHEQMLALEVFAKRLGGGVVFLGGRSSYTLGGYNGTPLERMLPVRLEPPPRSERPPITFLLVLDRSASMGMRDSAEAPQHIALAREAAMRAIETMRPSDWVGVLAFNDEWAWDPLLGPLGSGLSLRQVLDAVSRLTPDGSTRMYSALQEGLAQMISLPANAPRARHVLVLSDGKSSDGSPRAFAALAEAARAQNITLSTIAFGEDADAEVLEALAIAGKGRFYAVTEANDLPRILIYESQAARSENVQAGQTAIQAGEAGHPILWGMAPGDLPQLRGYNALSSRAEEGAEDVLVSSSFRDPILAAWQYGLGRVIAWTSDSGEEWTDAWPSVEAEGRFWSQVARYALPNPALGPAQVNVREEGSRLVVEAALFTASGEPLNLAEPVFRFAGREGEARNFAVPQTGPGEYRLEMPRPAEGAYRAVLAYQDEQGVAVETAAPFAVSSPDEWLPAAQSLPAQDPAAWAAAGGGRGLQLGDLAGETNELALQPGSRRPAWTGLLLALVLLWPLEIAARRRWLPWN